MSPEGVPQVNPSALESVEDAEVGYDGEAVRAQAEQQLQEMLAEVEVDESVPDKFVEVARLERLIEDLDRVDVDNRYRHVARAAAVALDYLLGNMSQRDFNQWNQFQVSRSQKFAKAA